MQKRKPANQKKILKTKPKQISQSEVLENSEKTPGKKPSSTQSTQQNRQGLLQSIFQSYCNYLCCKRTECCNTNNQCDIQNFIHCLLPYIKCLEEAKSNVQSKTEAGKKDQKEKSKTDQDAQSLMVREGLLHLLIHQFCKPVTCPSPCQGRCTNIICRPEPYCGPLFDDEENFLESTLPYVRTLSNLKRMQLRTLFLNSIFKIMQENEDYFSKPDETKDCCVCGTKKFQPSKPRCLQDEDELFYLDLVPYMKMLPPEKRLQARLMYFDHLFTIYEDVLDMYEDIPNYIGDNYYDKKKKYTERLLDAYQKGGHETFAKNSILSPKRSRRQSSVQFGKTEFRFRDDSRQNSAEEVQGTLAPKLSHALSERQISTHNPDPEVYFEDLK